MPREDLLIHIRTLYDDLGFKQAQANMQGLRATADQTTATLSRQEATFLSAAKAAQESAIVDTILARAKQMLATITAQQTAGMLTEAEAQQALLTLNQSTIAALSQYMPARVAEIRLLEASTFSTRELAKAQAELAASTRTGTAETEKQSKSLWKLTAQNRLVLPGGGGLFRLYGPALGIAGLTMLIGGLKGATEAAEKEDRALASLSATLRNVTPNYEQATQAAHDFTLGLAYQSMFTHEELLDGFQRLVALGVPLSQVYDMLTTATDLATARNIGLDNAVEALGRAYAGQTMRLSRLGIVMWDATGRVKSFEEVQKELNERFGGTAAAQMDTAIGRMHQYQTAISEVKEELGRFIEEVKANFSQAFLELIARGTATVTDDIAVLQAQIGNLNKALEEILLSGTAIRGLFPEILGREAGYVTSLGLAMPVEGYEQQIAVIKRLIAEKRELIKELEKEYKHQQDILNGYTGLAGAIKKWVDDATSARQKARQEIAQENQEYQDQIDLYKSLLEQTSQAGDYSKWIQFKGVAVEAIDDIIAHLTKLLEEEEAQQGGMDLMLRAEIQKFQEYRQEIARATFWEPQIELQVAKVDYAKAIGDTRLLKESREELLKIYEKEIVDLKLIAASGESNFETQQKLYEILTKQAQVLAEIKKEEKDRRQFVLEQAQFGYEYGTAGVSEYLIAIDRRLEEIRSEQEGLNEDSAEYRDLVKEANSLLQKRRELILEQGQFALEQAQFSYEYGTTGTEAYLAAIDQRIEELRKAQRELDQEYQKQENKKWEDVFKGLQGTPGIEQYLPAIAQRIEEIKKQQQGLNQESEEYKELEKEIYDLELRKKQIVDSVAEAEANYQIAYAEYQAKATGNQQELLNFYKLYKQELENQLATLIPGTEAWYEKKIQIVSADEKILDLTNDIAKAEERATEISYHRTVASNAMEYYQGKNLGMWEKAKRDYLEALNEEEDYLKTLLAQTPQGTKEQWSILSQINDLDYERLRIMEKQFETEKGITNELKMQNGLFNLPEFVRYGLPMLLAPQVGGAGGGGGGAPSIHQQNTINIYGGYQMTAQDIASTINKEIQKFSQMAGNAIWYGVR